MKALLLSKMDDKTKRKLYAGMELSVKGRRVLKKWGDLKLIHPALFESKKRSFRITEAEFEIYMRDYYERN